MAPQPQEKPKTSTGLQGPKWSGSASPLWPSSCFSPPPSVCSSHLDSAPSVHTSSMLPPQGLCVCCPSACTAHPQISPWLPPALSSEVIKITPSQRLLPWLKFATHPGPSLSCSLFSHHLSLSSKLDIYLCLSAVCLDHTLPQPGCKLHEDRNFGFFVPCPHVPEHIVGDAEWVPNKYILNEQVSTESCRKVDRIRNTHLNH